MEMLTALNILERKMISRAFRFVWMMVLFVSLGFTTGSLQAETGADGTVTSSSKTISSTTSASIVTVNVSLSSLHSHICIVNAHVEFNNPYTGANSQYNPTYLFGISMDGGSLVGNTSATFIPDAQIDESFKSVDITYPFFGVTGTHTFALKGRKGLSGYPSTTVGSGDATITAQCFETRL
jgi:hypothetical protein